MRYLPALALIPSALFLLSACGGGSSTDSNSTDDDAPASSSAVRTSNVSPGASCANGGVQIDSGIDENGNGLLDSDEVDASHTVCHGENGMDGSNGSDGTTGLASLVSVTPIVAGGDCPAGGIRVDSGIDDNADGNLSSSEIDSTQTLCNGSNGQTGNDGTDGTNGVDGQDGSNGLSSLLKLSEEPRGEHCEYGGTRVDSGLDTDGDGTLSDSEISATEYLCNLSPGLFGGLVFTADPDIFRMNQLLASSEDGQVRATLATPLSADGSVDSFKRSPDKRWVALTMWQWSGDTTRLYLADARGERPLIEINVENLFRYEWAPDGSRLAVETRSSGGKDAEIFTVRADGTARAVVTQNLPLGDRLGKFQWAPDSSRIAYQADTTGDGEFELYTVLAKPGISGVDRHRIDEAAANSSVVEFEWSPEGDRLAYRADSRVDGQFELFTADPTGAANVRISANMQAPDDVDWFSWAPNSEKVSYGVSGDLFVVNADGTQSMEMATPGNQDVIDQALWSPNSQYLTALLAASDLGIFPIDGRDSYEVSGTLLVRDEAEAFGWGWAPNSDKLLFRAKDPNSVTDSVLYTVQTDGTDLSQLSAGMSAGEHVDHNIAWSPSGDAVAYVMYGPGYGARLMVSAPDGSTHTVTAEMNVNIESFSWSPNSTAIAFKAYPDESIPEHYLYVAHADGSPLTPIMDFDGGVGFVADYSW